MLTSNVIAGPPGAQRRFFTVMGIIMIALTLAGVFIKIRRRVKEVRARHEQIQAEKALEWKKYRRIYEVLGMADVWSLYQAGRCAEGKQLLENNWPQYHDGIAKKLNGGESGVRAYLGMAVKGYDTCQEDKY